MMLINHLIIALRMIRRHKVHAAINILGLAFAMAVSILMLLYIQDDLDYEEGHADADETDQGALDQENAEPMAAVDQRERSQAHLEAVVDRDRRDDVADDPEEERQVDGGMVPIVLPPDPLLRRRVALDAGADEVLPSVPAALDARDDVVEREFLRREMLATILTAIVIASVDVAAVELDVLERQAVVAEQANDLRHGQRTGLCRRRNLISPGQGRQTPV